MLGSFYEAVDATAWFLSPDLPVAYLKRRNPSDLSVFTSLPGQIVQSQPIYIWTSPYTASAAEVFIRALQVHAQQVTVVGTKTKGKCLSQQHVELQDSSSLSLSTYEILTPDKERCNGGVVPDIVIDEKNITSDCQYFKKSLPLQVLVVLEALKVRIKQENE